MSIQFTGYYTKSPLKNILIKKKNFLYYIKPIAIWYYTNSLLNLYNKVSYFLCVLCGFFSVFSVGNRIISIFSMEIWYYTNSPLILYNKAIFFCLITIYYFFQRHIFNGDLVLYQFAIYLIQYQFFGGSACAKNRSAQFLHSSGFAFRIV